jgi:hypothetical protein
MGTVRRMSVEVRMPSAKTVMHLVNDKGAILCPRRTSPHKLRRESWDKLAKDEQCGNCKRVLARKEGREKIHFGTACVHRKKASTESTAASYTPRHGQIE